MRLPTLFRFILLVGFAICLPALLADDAKPKEEKDDFKLFEGSWKAVALETDGRKAPPEAIEASKDGRWSFKGPELQTTEPSGKAAAKMTVTLDASKSPKQIDLAGIEGQGKGKKMQGIYKFEKGLLVICLRDQEAAEKGRPTEFATEAGSGVGMITLERVKE
jgi:uncharacterized protein (TIGR03067 family)